MVLTKGKVKGKEHLKLRCLVQVGPDCRRMQLRVFVKTNLSGGACPRTPLVKLRTYGARTQRLRRSDL